MSAPDSVINVDKIDRIIFFGNAGIGNFILYLPTLRTIKQLYGNLEITCIILKKQLREIARQCHFIDKIIDMTNPSNFLKICTLHKAAVLLSIHDCYIYPLALSIFSRPKYIVGFERVAHWKNKYSQLLTHTITVDKITKEVLYSGKLLEPFGVPHHETTFSAPFFPALKKAGYDGLFREKLYENLLIGMHVSSSPSQPWKAWELHKFSKISELIIDNFPNTRLLFFGTPDAATEIDNVIKTLPSNRCEKLIGHPLSVVAYWLSKCFLLVCNDGGLMHIADALGIKTVAIFGPTDHRIFGPSRGSVVRLGLSCSPCYSFPGDQKYPLRCKDRLCLKRISAELVWKFILDVLEGLK
ncbi:MAG: hypothetical protein DRG83_14850 [Deltaproteobacteria bacterium]|nr:MAG: hypothetical protein DRG83_14850 [Deltaproteobacteria bacterium]